ncbi:MAG: citrate/2-methylcitrate synthase [Lentisphaerae bacterium]|nr:citrate/2-methylcitrate synthase [Lentisphaerota bacterium]
MIKTLARVTDIVLKAGAAAQKEIKGGLQPAFSGNVQWPVECKVGPGLEGAIACESKVGYVNGSQGALLYRGYTIFDLCAYATFEEVAYLLTRGSLPTATELTTFKEQLNLFRSVPLTLRRLMSFPVEDMHAMAALRLGTNLMRQEFTSRDLNPSRGGARKVIGTDEDSIPMETLPKGTPEAVYQFTRAPGAVNGEEDEQTGYRAALHLLSGVSTIAAAIARVKRGQMPIDPDPELSFAANYLYMLNGRRPTPVEERIMDISLILHADHGMNASTFAAVVVASTLSDMYASVGAGVAALTGPLHGGANEDVMKMLDQIGDAANVPQWFAAKQARKEKIAGFGHRVYKTYDPRARILGPLAREIARDNPETKRMYATAAALEKVVVTTLGKAKGIYPNVDFFSGLVYRALGIPTELFTPTFAVSRVAGWTARVLEYLEHNRLFRPRAIYTGPTDCTFIPLNQRDRKS